jgi:hypothetical protein
MAGLGASRRADGFKEEKSVLVKKSEEGALSFVAVTRLGVTGTNASNKTNAASVHLFTSTYHSTATMIEGKVNGSQ